MMLLSASLTLAASGAHAADLVNGNAAVEVVIPAVAPVVFQDVSGSAGDATLVLRVTAMVTNAWFDATAPYTPNAVGVYSRIANRPGFEYTDNENMNVALLHASYHTLNGLLPHRNQDWRNMLVNEGLDPDDLSVDPTTAVGIGNLAGQAVAAGRAHDGMNQMGDEGGRYYNPMPYMDYTGYEPVNTAYELTDPSSWQPEMQRQGVGLYKIQQFVTPQYALVEPYSYNNPKQFNFLPPVDSNHHRYSDYKAQADAVLQASADLTELQKAKAELFDNKIESLGFSAVFAGLSRGLTLRQFIELDFLTNMAAFDAGIVVWQEKAQYDAVRPFSAIQYLYGDDLLTAWGGPGLGTVSDMPASEWKSYMNNADHPEYPSASTCFCYAHAQSARLYLGDDNLGWTAVRPAGSSRIEPGISPASDLYIVYPTWTEFAEDCGQSRVWAGVHFQAAVDESARQCDVFGDMAYDYLNSLIDGTAPVRGPSVGSGN